MTTNRNTYTGKIIDICDKLPEFCTSFLLETVAEHAPRTRLAYAHELSMFFDYMINFHPHFCEMKKTDITLADLRIISTSDINRYLTISLDSLSVKTVARKRAALSSFFSYMSSGTDRKIDINPVAGASPVKIPPKDTVIYLDIEQQKRLLSSVNYGTGLDKKKEKYHERYQKRDSAIILLLLDTGMRVSELNGLDIKDLDFEDCSAIITRKGGKIQTLYYSDECCSYLSDYLTERRTKYPLIGSDEPFFVTLQGERLSVRAIEEMVKKYAKASLGDIASNISPHKLRSSFAMAYYQASNKDLLALQRELGHNSLMTTNIYAKASDKTLENNRSILQNARNA